MRLIITTLIILATLSMQAQTEPKDTIKKSVDMDEIVISVNKTEEMKRHIASQITVITSKQIQFDNPQTSADIIANTGQIMVQKSQQGGGSPVIRGFEASRVLMVVDGVRMNNLIYRGGHLQNIVTIDPSMLEKVEIFFGPSSTIYGSDALGGTIHFMTKKPRLDATDKKMLSLNFMQRYSSVNNGTSTNFNFNLGFKKMASLTSISYNKFGDLKMGKNKNPFYDTLFGLRKVYALHTNGRDSAVISDNAYIQTQSGYSQMDLLQKFLYKPNNSIEHQLNVQYSNSSNIPRYDRLTELTPNGQPRFSEWYYGPQNRLMVAYDLNLRNKFGFNNIHIGLSGQQIQESRINRDFGDSILKTRIEEVGVLGYNLDLQKFIKKHKFRFGFDGQANTLKSNAQTDNIITEEVGPLDTRYPDGKNTLNHNSVYFTHSITFTPKLILNDGLRFGTSNLKSEIKTNYFNLPVTYVEQNNYTRSAYVGVVYNPIQTVKLSYLVSTGFRVPNVDDLAKVFDTKKGNVIIPNPDLKPEQTITNELGLSFKPSKAIRIESSVWYTNFNNAITVNARQLNGNDSVLYDGVMSKVYTNTNSQKAVIFGYSASINANITANSQVYANYSFTKGTITSTDIRQPLDHISPVTANLGYSHVIKKLTLEGIINFNGKKDMKDYSATSTEDNPQYAPPGGMPAWMTANLRLSYKINKKFVLQGGVENILDTNYRVFASGINGPGRNFYAAVRFSM